MLYVLYGNKLYFDYRTRLGVGSRCAGGGNGWDEWWNAGELNWRNWSLGKEFCCGWRGRRRWWHSRRDPMFGLFSFFPSFVDACLAKMGLFRWATVAAVKMIFSPF